MKYSGDDETLILNLHDIGCENKCIFCGQHKKIKKIDCDKIANEQIKKLNYLTKNKNVKYIIISGNDPIEYYDFIGFLKKIKKKTDLKIFLQSHCNNFSDFNYLKQILSVGNIERIQVPLYGNNAKIHDAVTRHKGSFGKVKKALKNLNILGFNNINLHTLFLKQNENHLMNLFLFLFKYNYPIDVSLPCIPSFNGQFDKNVFKFIPSISKIKKFFEQFNKNENLISKISVYDIPLCIAKNIKNFGFMSSVAHKGYEHFKNKKIDIIKINQEVVASYRVLSKTALCNKCVKDKICQGITRPYYDLNLFEAEPLHQDSL